MELIILMPLGVCLLAFVYCLWQDALDRAARRYNELTRYNPDELGNYPGFFDPRSDRSLVFDPGNKAFPDMQPPAPIKMPLDRPIVVRNYRPAELSGTATEPASAEVQNGSEPDYIGLLTEAKEKGMAPSRAIPAVTGCSKGGGKAYRTWLEIWQTL